MSFYTLRFIHKSVVCKRKKITNKKENMAHNPKLEVYQVWLNPNRNEEKTFRDFLIETIEENNNEIENSEIYLNFFKKFIRTIDTDDFIANNRKKKAFTAYDTNSSQPINSTISIKPNKNVIEGTIEGGKYGLKRNKSSVGNKSNKEGINQEDIILDKFYFSLYTPLDSELGILFIQSYSTETISDIFSEFIKTFFSLQGSYKKAKVEKFVPTRLVNEFRNSSNVKRFTFNTRFVFNQLSNSPIGLEEEEFVIKIEAVSKHGLSKESLPNWINAVGSKVFNSTPLSNFNKGKVYLKNTDSKKETPFDIDSDLEIKPVIYLENRISIGMDGIPNFSELSDYCANLLENEIIPEMYITDEVVER